MAAAGEACTAPVLFRVVTRSQSLTSAGSHFVLPNPEVSMDSKRPVAPWSRRQFLVSSLLGAGLAAAPWKALAQTSPAAGAPRDSAKKVAAKPPPLAPEIVREFVGAAHGNLDRTREMLGNEPGLLNATWDWKAGDFEAAIGGAGHMGRRDIALYLIEQGARSDLFVSAMLGELSVVRALLETHPGMARSKGPHGITLMAHAKAGGAQAAEVVGYLESLEAR